jgi:SanA protein
MRRRVILGAAGALGVLALALVAYANWAVPRAARGRLFDLADVDAGSVPGNRVALVLGCARTLPDGRANLYFVHRIAAAARLFAAGKVQYLLLSGDNGRHGYDEPSDMRDALVAAGVPADRIVLDYAGFRTLDSVVRAQQVFGLQAVTLISQRFHDERALYIARHLGLDAVAVCARDVTGAGGLTVRVRELFARVKTVLDLHVLGTGPRFLGPRVPIGEPPGA